MPTTAMECVPSRCGIARGEQKQRRIENFAQLLGIARVVKSDQLRAEVQHFLLLVDSVVETSSRR